MAGDGRALCRGCKEVFYNLRMVPLRLGFQPRYTVATWSWKPPHPRNWPRLSLADISSLPRFAGDYCNDRPANTDSAIAA